MKRMGAYLITLFGGFCGILFLLLLPPYLGEGRAVEAGGVGKRA